MVPAGDDWILIQGSDAETIRGAIIANSELAGYEQPAAHRVSISGFGDGRFAVRFDPKLPPLAFVGLLSWLSDPQMTAGSGRAVGWFTSPGSGRRYYLAPRSGDTLVGLADDGTTVTVGVMDCGLHRFSGPVEPLPEPPLRLAHLLLQFEIEADADPSFGNPQFLGDRMVLFDRRGRMATIEGIERHIRELDGVEDTEAMYTDETKRIILHAAGGAGDYLVSLTWPGRVLNLAGPDPEATDLVSFVAAGQRVEVPRGVVADLRSALQAARHFARSGEPNPSLKWFAS